MLAHDLSVRDARWQQVVRADVGAVRESMTVGEYSLETDGRWAGSVVAQLWSSGDTRAIVRESFAYDGLGVTTGLDHGSKTGSIQDYSGTRGGKCVFGCWLGRELDPSGGQRLGELLLSGGDLEYLGVSDVGLPMIGGVVQLYKRRSYVEVEIDPGHGFAPRTIIDRDPKVRVPYATYRVLDYVEVNGVWLPERCRVTTKTFSPSGSQMAALEAALSRRGLSRESDAADHLVREGFRTALVEAFGSDEGPAGELVPEKEVLFLYEAVNTGLDKGAFQIDVPRSYEVLDVFRDHIKPAWSDRWVPNG